MQPADILIDYIQNQFPIQGLANPGVAGWSRCRPLFLRPTTTPHNGNERVLRAAAGGRAYTCRVAERRRGHGSDELEQHNEDAPPASSVNGSVFPLDGKP